MKKLSYLIFFVIITFILPGCATKLPQNYSESEDQKAGSSLRNLPLKINGVLFFLDASDSMFTDYKGSKKYDIALRTAARMSEVLPADIDILAGIQVAAPSLAPYGMTKYSKSDFAASLKTFETAAKGSALEESLKAGGRQLARIVDKRIAAIILSDGIEPGKDFQRAAEKLKVQLGRNICFYPIQIGDSPQGRYTLELLNIVGKCGSLATTDQLASSKEMNAFVEKAFFETGTDADGDGVVDTLDRCLHTPKGKEVNAEGCPREESREEDSDGDGVVDFSDQCPNTSQGTKVNAVGCPQKDIHSAGLIVEFDTGKAAIKSNSHADLKRFAEFMKKHPSAVAVIAGHIDSREEKKNRGDLSLARARAIERYLIDKLKINPEQLQTQGLGAQVPKASNETEEGRRHNRRVESTVTVEVEPES